MSPAQLKKLQELSQIFSQGKANPKQIQQLSALLAQINQFEDEHPPQTTDDVAFVAAPRFG
ncbi:hypothetical protein [Litorilituus lipolyticus]|uniref:Uncharacterized protein n=1 Tax=Litorilituus lipolyticus TaxID=2491017 RepID=A0A502L3B9_9GAMM|nr:hypothetical protein [Litorilituus lipolyticus]TPH17674.1 hypothetical protein EPA86_03740 [Litorilituus lipolyticus]